MEANILASTMDITIEITVAESAGTFKRSKSVVISIPGFLMDMEADEGDREGEAVTK